MIPFIWVNPRWVSWTGLIVGSMIPDFEGFFRLGGPKHISHTWAGMFWFDLPLGIAVAFIFHLLVRNILIDQLPSFLRRRVVQFKEFDWLHYVRKHWGVFIVSMLVGIASHLLWDRITHTDSYGYDERMGFEFDWYESVMVRQWLQFGCTFLGMAVIAWQVAALPAKQYTLNRKWWNPYWFIVAAICGFIVWIRYHKKGYNEGVFFHSLVAGILLGIVIACIAFYFFSGKLRKHEEIHP